jgi:SLT domain-containing protein
MEDFIVKGIGPAQAAMKKLAELTIAGANTLNELTPGGKKIEGTTKEVVSTVGGAGIGAGVGAVAGGLIGLLGGPAGAVLGAKLGAVIGTGIGGYLLKNTAGDLIDKAQGTEPPGRAAGGPVDAGKLYKVGESGEEFFRPKLAGEIIPNNKLAGMTSGNTVSNPPVSDTIKSLVSSLSVVSKSMTTGSREMDDAFDEIVKDSAKLERLTDVDTKRAEKYSLAYKSYVDLKTQLMDLETPDLKSQIDILQQKAAAAGAPATGNAGGAPGGTGMKMPTAGNMPTMGGGQGVAGGIASQNDLTKMGLKLKTGDVQAEGSKIDPKIIELAQQVQANMPNFAYFSGFNDKFHQEKSPSSSHTTGRAMDFALSKQPSVEEGQEITKWLKSMGASVAIDEYNNPSAKATAGHIHAQIPGYADGGIASTPQIAMVAEKGPEAMIPLDKGAIPINLNMDAHLAKIFETGFGELSAQFAKLNDIDLLKSTVSDFKNGNFGLADPKDIFKSESTEARASLDQGAKVYEKLLADALEKQAAQQAEQSSRMIDALFEMIRTQKDSNSIQERILQTSM